jgi:putative lipoic acid-binding regulatory protein
VYNLGRFFLRKGLIVDTKFDELLDFPCFQTFKILGVADPELPNVVVARLQQLAPGDYSPTVKPSAKGNYHSVSVSVKVTSKEHMETIYTEISALDLVRVVI